MSDSRGLLSIVTPCYNEEDNVIELYERLNLVTRAESHYEFEILFIDNHSVDSTVEKLKALAAKDKRVKVIVNARNFGHIRSPYYGILQSRGAATIYLASDLQDPPELIPQFIRQWEAGYRLVMATKPVSQGHWLMHNLRKTYYRVLDRISEVPLTHDTTGFGLYDKVVLDLLRDINDPYPYLRGLVCELGYEIKLIPFEQHRRMRGITKNNFYTLYDIAMLGLVSHSKVPIRLAAFLGVVLGATSMLLAVGFLALKLLFWDLFPLGISPILVGMFFLFGLMFLFMGIIGEYIAVIHTFLQKRPVVVEQERINF